MALVENDVAPEDGNRCHGLAGRGLDRSVFGDSDTYAIAVPLGHSCYLANSRGRS